LPDNLYPRVSGSSLTLPASWSLSAPGSLRTRPAPQRNSTINARPRSRDLTRPRGTLAHDPALLLLMPLTGEEGVIV